MTLNKNEVEEEISAEGSPDGIGMEFEQMNQSGFLDHIYIYSYQQVREFHRICPSNTP